MEGLSCHGKVIDAFIPSKRGSDGRRFGFVRFAYLQQQMQEGELNRLNRFRKLGSRLRVSKAKYRRRRSYWRKKGTEKSEKGDGSVGDMERSEVQTECERVIDKNMWNILQRCIVAKGKEYWKIEELAKMINEDELHDFTLIYIYLK